MRNWKSSRILQGMLGLVHMISVILLIIIVVFTFSSDGMVTSILKGEHFADTNEFSYRLNQDYDRLVEYLQRLEDRRILSNSSIIIRIYDEQQSGMAEFTYHEVLEMYNKGLYCYDVGNKWILGGGSVEKNITAGNESTMWTAEYFGQDRQVGSNNDLGTLFFTIVSDWISSIGYREERFQVLEEEFRNTENRNSNFCYCVIRQNTGEVELSYGIGSAVDSEGLLRNGEAVIGQLQVYYGLRINLDADDWYANYAQRYQEAEGWRSIYLLVLAGTGVCWIFSMLGLLVCTGHRQGKEEIALTRFDHMRLEGYVILMILLLFGMWCVVAFPAALIGSGVGYGSSYLTNMAGWGSILCAVYLGCFWLLFTCVRRFKAKIPFADNFLLLTGIRKMFRWLCDSLAGLYLNRTMAGRVMLIFAGYVTLSTFLLFLWTHTYSSFFSLILFLLLALLHLFIAALLLRYVGQRHRIAEGAMKQAQGDWEYQIDTKGMWLDEKLLAESINHMSVGLQKAVDSATRNERMKTELIVNVSHDIKTPLTSIINYVDLIRREQCDNEKIIHYIEILDQKSQRLKQLTEDLVEAAKANTGNIELNMVQLNMVELLQQATGELEDKFLARNLQVISQLPEEEVTILADGRRLWRVFENLLNNACKYAMPGTRVYLDMRRSGGKTAVIIKNISESQLNIPADELTERFTRGDASRSTEGSGLGLSIAKSLTELMGGTLELYLDGDLFRVTVEFSEIPRETGLDA